MTDPLTFLKTRRSRPAKIMTGPVPGKEALEALLVVVVVVDVRRINAVTIAVIAVDSIKSQRKTEAQAIMIFLYFYFPINRSQSINSIQQPLRAILIF